MPGHQHLLPDLQGSCVRRLGLPEPAAAGEERPQLRKRRGDVGMVRAHCLFADGDGPPEHGLRFGMPALVAAKPRHRQQAGGHLEMVGPELLFINGKGALVQGSGLVVAVPDVVEDCEVCQ